MKGEKEEKTCGNENCGACGPEGQSKCPGVPILIILFGFLFLLNANGLIEEEVLKMTWPVIIILIGLLQLTKKICPFKS